MSETIQLEVSLATAPPLVFQALTRSDELMNWFAESAYVSQADGHYDFWELSLENLRSWVERRVVGARCDFSGALHGDVYLEVEIAATPAAIFHALITPEELDRFFATKAVVEPRIGGSYDFGWLNCINRLKFLVEVGLTWQPPKLTMQDRSEV